MNKKTILIVEDEGKIAEAVEAYLKKNGYITLVAYDGKQALSLMESQCPDMLILDLMLPYVSGLEICKEVRKYSKIPIIMLTAKVDEDSKIHGLNIGADDYITKPFSPRELVARVNSLFRRYDAANMTVTWSDGNLEINFEAHTVKKQGRIVSLTPNEFKILTSLVKYPNKTFTRDELIELALGHDFDGYDRTVDSHIKNLRSKIEFDSGNPKYVLTVRGVGYKFGGETQ